MAQDKRGTQVQMHGLVDGRKTVTSAGTAVPLSATSIQVDYVIIMAETDNTGYICVGASTVVATVLTRRGIPLYAGDTPLVLEAVDLSQVYIDSVVSGDGVTFLYES